ncbi:MAG: hypothetical protein F4060_09695 [Holophagales bacterium]|nr:hypothetical protein [Holophagales bacterium]MYG32188.1 hypothetical protein [Holophagales bacterium]MYI80203.1 hypothetical protein [Holophagales bacterium]
MGRTVAALVTLALAGLSTPAAAQVDERAVLEAFYDGTGGDNWTNNTNWKDDSTAIGEWFGVEVDRSGRVISLVLSSNGLTGNIPPSLGELPSLLQLFLSLNDLTGSIPPELGALTNLLSLELSFNGLTGTIPGSLGELSHLVGLGLAYNDLTGSVPAALGDLADLEGLSLESNRLGGRIPRELGALSNLRLLNLSSNELTGSIPVELAALSNLQQLYLSSNELTGSIPVELGGLSDLQLLDLSSNGLDGTIPSEIGDLSSLTLLGLHSNRLAGNIPRQLGDLSDLFILALDSNRLSGNIPPELGDLGDLSILALQSNRLTGSIPAELGALANLERLYLEDNDLTGEVPAGFSRLASLTDFRARGTNRVCLPASLLGWYGALAGETDAIPTCGVVVPRLTLTVDQDIVVRGRTVTFRALTDADADRYTWTVAGEVVDNDSATLRWSFQHPGWNTITATAAFVDDGGMPVGEALTASLGVEVLSEDDSRANVCASEDPLELCLGDDRFAVTVGFFDPKRQGWASARPRPFSRDTGFFTFFDETNVEVMVKVLDACGVNRHRWVFAGGATDLGIRLTVLDNATERSAGYETGGGRPFRAITDLRAFGCSEGIREPGAVDVEVDVAAADGDGRYPGPPVGVRSGVEVIPVGRPEAGACRFPDSSKVCLHDGRFSATAEYQDPRTAEWKPAAANSLTRDTGYYTFLQPGNVEIFLKVLDACATNGRYWVYMGGATDLAVRVKVEHQPEAEGEVRGRDYETGRGPFVAVRDNRAFACPP